MLLKAPFIFLERGVVVRKERIASFVNSNEYVPMSKENMAVLLCVPASDMEIFFSVIKELIDEGVLIEGRKKRLFRPNQWD